MIVKPPSPITEEKIRAVNEAEVFLREQGFKEDRVRHHGHVARIEISPEDAGGISVKTGEYLKITSRRGTINIKAKITKKVAPGIVFIPFHFAEAAVNELTLPALDPISKIPELKVAAVRIEKI